MDEEVLRTIRQAGVTVDEAMDRLAELKRKPAAASVSDGEMHEEAPTATADADAEPSPLPVTVDDAEEGDGGTTSSREEDAEMTAGAADTELDGNVVVDVVRDPEDTSDDGVDTGSVGGDVHVGVSEGLDPAVHADEASEGAGETEAAEGRAEADGAGDTVEHVGATGRSSPERPRAAERRLEELARALRRETQMLMAMLDRADSMPRITVAVADELARRTESVGRLTSDVERLRRSVLT